MRETRKIKRARRLREKRPDILLMPTSQDHTLVSFFVGIACRGLVAAAFVFGLTLLFADAMTMVEEIVPFETLLWPSLIFALAITAMHLHKAAFFSGLVILPAGVFVWINFIIDEYPVSFIGHSFKLFINTVIDRLAFAGLAEIKLYRFSESYRFYDEVKLMSVALALFALVVAVLTVPAIIKRVRLAYLSLAALVFLTPITAYNIIRDNWGFSMLIISYAALIALWIYDRKYLRRAKDQTVCADGTELSAAFAVFDEPEIIPEKKRRERIKRPRGKDRDIESALRLETPAQRRRRKSEERRAVHLKKREAKAKKRNEKRLLRSAETRKRMFEAAALGGPVGAAVFAVLFLVIVIPTAAVETASEGLPYIDVVIGRARLYVTAFLSGSEIDLNETGTISGMESGLRDVSVNYPEYNDILVATVETPYNTPVYLRAWIGEHYKNNKWTTAGVADIKKYRKKFGDEFTPEMITENFYNAIYPEFDDFSEGSGYKNNIKYGFITERVNVTRRYGSGMLLYMPSASMPSRGLMRYRDSLPSLLPNEPYYEGIWMSRYFIEGVQYSTVSNVASYRVPDMGSVFTNGIEYYKMSMQFILETMLEGEEDIDKKIGMYESLLEAMGISYSGNSLGRRFFTEMTDEERKQFLEADVLEKKYAEFVKETYTQTDSNDSSRIRLGTLNILNANMREYFGGQSLPAGFWSGEVDAIDEKYYHEIAMTLIDYLSENMTYSIEPPEASEETGLPETALPSGGFFSGGPLTSYEEETSALIKFLAYEKTGYCVQYASALTMMLRSLGIPARYCEGFIVSEFSTDFHGNDDPLTRYRADVYDNNAHAWVEVYYDSMGWVQYEATETFLDGMYGTELPDVETGGEIDISKPNDKPDVPDEPEGDIDDILKPNDDGREKFIKIAIITGIAVGALTVVGAVIYVIFFIKRAKRTVRERHDLIRLTGEGGAEYSREEMRSPASELIKGIFSVYGALDLHPEVGELSPEYAERLADAIGDASDITPEMLLDAVSKEEFGHGMTRRELALVSEYYSDLTKSVYDGLGHRDRFSFRYVKRIV